jgi:hypothetical protein
MFYASYRRRIPICLSGGEHISRLVETLALVGALAYIRKFFYKRKIFFELKCYKKRQLYKIYEPLYYIRFMNRYIVAFWESVGI